MANEPGEVPGAEFRRMYEEAESRTARAFEQAVGRDSFGELLARVTENVVGITKIGSDIFDLALRNLRLAGRQDLTRLARQLNRTEDKIELLLQEVERLQDRLDSAAEQPSPNSQASARRAGRASRVRGTPDGQSGHGAQSRVAADGAEE
jgi:hypothetical protein